MTPGEYDFYDKDATPNTFMEKWAALGFEFSYNELRACWKLGGQGVGSAFG